MRGLLILLAAFTIMLTARSHHQKGFEPRQTTPMPPVNVP
ncbi:hypothetical protein SAMN05216525_15918 [Bradyrhizobium sp. Gha]|nr:hypothetical protein SAMN05216525_15918 [Bradyrhizobium sp. Gha]